MEKKLVKRAKIESEYADDSNPEEIFEQFSLSEFQNKEQEIFFLLIFHIPVSNYPLRS